MQDHLSFCSLVRMGHHRDFYNFCISDVLFHNFDWEVHTEKWIRKIRLGSALHMYLSLSPLSSSSDTQST